MEGIKQGMVMQRNGGNVCDIVFSAPQPPQRAIYTGRQHGQAAITPLGAQRYRLTGIPAGGPYTLEVDAERFDDIYVGDVWILAGQSNMEGVGHMTAEDLQFRPQPDVRALFLSNNWGAAQVPLHDLGGAHFKVHDLLLGASKPAAVSVGPGLSFALRMKAYTGVPQGLICCAHGATNLACHWDPSIRNLGTDKSLYAAMAQRVTENGGSVRGIFWYQGCSDAENGISEVYGANMEQFVAACRADFGENLPFVQVQIGRTINRPNEDYCRWWNRIQEQQRLLSQKIPHFCTLSAISKGLDDFIHLDSPSQKALGEEAAEAMYYLVFGTDARGCLPPPDFAGMRVETIDFNNWAVLHLRYANLHGGLHAQSRPVGFSVIDRRPEHMPQLVYKVTLEHDEALVHVAATAQELHGLELYYGYGQDPVCNITDAAGRAIPVMGPILL